MWRQDNRSGQTVHILWELGLEGLQVLITMMMMMVMMMIIDQGTWDSHSFTRRRSQLCRSPRMGCHQVSGIFFMFYWSHKQLDYRRIFWRQWFRLKTHSLIWLRRVNAIVWLSVTEVNTGFWLVVNYNTNLWLVDRNNGCFSLRLEEGLGGFAAPEPHGRGGHQRQQIQSGELQNKFFFFMELFFQKEVFQIFFSARWFTWWPQLVVLRSTTRVSITPLVSRPWTRRARETDLLQRPG